MSGALVRLSFSRAERELTRKKLIRYMEENGIGAPRLARRIQAVNFGRPEIPVKTLQRFLTGRMRTNDSSVALFYRFAASLPDPDTITALGERLSLFYGPGNVRDYSGIYACIPTSFEKNHKSVINVIADGEFCRVTEKKDPQLGHAIYDGVLVCSRDAAVVVLKDRQTDLARNYLLWPEEYWFRGLGSSAVYSAVIAEEAATEEEIEVERLELRLFPTAE